MIDFLGREAEVLNSVYEAYRERENMNKYCEKIFGVRERKETKAQKKIREEQEEQEKFKKWLEDSYVVGGRTYAFKIWREMRKAGIRIRRTKMVKLLDDEFESESFLGIRKGKDYPYISSFHCTFKS